MGLGIATIAVDQQVDPSHLARRGQLRGLDLRGRLLRLPHLLALYQLLAALAAARPGRIDLLAWEQGWHRSLRRLGIVVIYVTERIIGSNAETAAIKGMHHVMNAEYSRKLTVARRARLVRELERIRQLYKIDDAYTDQEYLADRPRIQRELDALAEVPVTRDYEAAAQVVADFPRLWRGSSDQTRKAILTTIFEEIRVRRDEVVQVKPRPRYLEPGHAWVAKRPPGSTPRGRFWSPASRWSLWSG